MLDVMNKAPTMRVPWSVFLESASLLQPRYYSVASSSSVHPHTLHLTVGLNLHNTQDGRVVRGVCSDFLCKRLTVNDRVPLFVKQSLFKLPLSVDTPIIMIGAGTGIAPHRGFLQKRAMQRARENLLIFGCRHRDIDFLYRDELASYIASGNLRLITAFSHDLVS